MLLRQGILATIIALMALAPAAAFARDGHHRGHRGHHNSAPRVGISLQFGSPYRHYGYGGHYNPHWNSGYWHHGWHGGRHGRWWVVGPTHYYYDPIPVYAPYETTRIVQQPAPVVASGPPPAQSWYLCEDSGYYYPHVSECASGWTEVPATPPATKSKRR